MKHSFASNSFLTANTLTKVNCMTHKYIRNYTDHELYIDQSGYKYPTWTVQTVT